MLFYFNNDFTVENQLSFAYLIYIILPEKRVLRKFKTIYLVSCLPPKGIPQWKSSNLRLLVRRPAKPSPRHF